MSRVSKHSVAVAVGVGLFALAVLTGSGPAEQDAAFLKQAIAGGQAEIQLGELAATRASREKVKIFAEKMRQDHASVNRDLSGLAEKRNIDVPAAAPAEKQQLADELGKLEGEIFDRTYMQHMVQDHEKAVDEFEREARDGLDPEVAMFAREQLPALREHLAMAKETEKTLR